MKKETADEARVLFQNAAIGSMCTCKSTVQPKKMQIWSLWRGVGDDDGGGDGGGEEEVYFYPFCGGVVLLFVAFRASFKFRSDGGTKFLYFARFFKLELDPKLKCLNLIFPCL